MFDTLPASRRLRGRHGAAGVLSLSTHVVVTAWAVGAGAPSAEPWRRPVLSEQRAGYTILPRVSEERSAPEARPARRASRVAAHATRAPAQPRFAAIDLSAIVEPIAVELSAAGDELARVGPEVVDFPAASPGSLRDAIAASLAGVSAGGGGYASFVERPVVPFNDNPRPTYPEELRRWRVEGAVRVQFVVDTTGAPDLASVRVLQSSHALFTLEVRRVLPQLHFLPAENGGTKVPVMAEQTFSFVLR